MYIRSILVALFLAWVSVANAQLHENGIPVPAGTFTPVNITYTNEEGLLVNEIFRSPDIIDDFGPIGFIDESPIDSNRRLDDLPTFGLAKWHWWLFGFITLPRAQRQYADCVGEIKGYQKLLGESPLIDDPRHSLYTTIGAVREYFVPFEVVQQWKYEDRDKPPTKEIVIAHVKAAIATHNITVYHLSLCKQTAAWYLKRVRAILK